MEVFMNLDYRQFDDIVINEQPRTPEGLPITFIVNEPADKTEQGEAAEKGFFAKLFSCYYCTPCIGIFRSNKNKDTK